MSLLFLAASRIKDISVSFKAEIVNEKALVSFQVDNSFDREEIKNKVAITKWLLKQWKYCLSHIEKEKLIPVCEVYTGDWNMMYRFKIFKKMGFKPVYGLGMVYGDNIIKETQELPFPIFDSSTMYYQFFLQDMNLYEGFFNKENSDFKGILFNEDIIGEFSIKENVWLIKWIGLEDVYKYTFSS